MATLTVEIIKEAAERMGFDLHEAFRPKDLGLDANLYGAFADYCENTLSGKWNKRKILIAVEFNKGGRPVRYKLLRASM